MGGPVTPVCNSVKSVSSDLALLPLRQTRLPKVFFSPFTLLQGFKTNLIDRSFCERCSRFHWLDECPSFCTSTLPCAAKPGSTEAWVCDECLDRQLNPPGGSWSPSSSPSRTATPPPSSRKSFIFIHHFDNHFTLYFIRPSLE